MPDELLPKLYGENINLFPNTWQHIQAECNCQDWGRPCEHISALYYKLSVEIDKNPFFSFSLKGINMVSEFALKTYTKTIEYPLRLDYSEHETNKFEKSIELFHIEDMSSFITSLLPKAPLFDQIDYQKVITEFYAHSSKVASQILFCEIEEKDKQLLSRIFQESKIRFVAAEDIYYSFFVIENPILSDELIFRSCENYGFNHYHENAATISALQLVKLFLSFEQKYLTPAQNFLYYFSRMCYLFTTANSFVPDVLLMKNQKSFQIIYKPLLIIKTVAKQIEQVTKLLCFPTQFKNRSLSAHSSIVFMTTSVLTSYAVELKFAQKRFKKSPSKLSLAFFSGEIFEIETFEEQNIAKAIDMYFGVFDLAQTKVKLQLIVSKTHEDYYLNFYIYKDGRRLPFKQALKTFPEEKQMLLTFISFLSSYLSGSKQLIDQTSITLSFQQLEELILQSSPLLKSLGIELIFPKEVEEIITPRLILSAQGDKKTAKSYLSLTNLLSYKWEIALGDVTLSKEEFEKLVEEGKKIVRFKGKLVHLPENECKKLAKQMEQKNKVTPFDIIQAALNDELIADSNTKKLIKNFLSTKKYPIPPNLVSTLRDYQVRGYQWLTSNVSCEFGVILADDMGLGKTIQTIAMLSYMKSKGKLKMPALLIVPTTLVTNWEHEINRFANDLTYEVYYGSSRSLNPKCNIIITTYQIALRDIEEFRKLKFSFIIADEAQKIKNSESKTTKAIKSLNCPRRIALSGTPLENNLSELWSLFDFILPGYLRNLKYFRKEFANKIEIERDKEAIEKLNKLTSPFILRRLKTDKSIIQDLPEKVVQDEFATMTKKQAALYQSVLNETLEKLENIDEEAIERKGLIFKLLTSLKQICNHPSNFDKTDQCNPKLSGKSQLLLTLLENIVERGEKVLIFTQYTEMGKILEAMIEKHIFIKPLFLHGGIIKQKRDEMVKAFQKGGNHAIFILSLKSGGVGLNLTQANHVIHYDLWYNPAVEQQATDRAFRIGQRKDVFVHRLITKESFEERINEMIHAKKELCELSVAAGEQWISNMDNKQLREVFELRGN